VYFTARQDLAAPFDRWLPLAVLIGGMSISRPLNYLKRV
jgi:hypothetical protein